jgi:uncharacterized protein (TIGR03066 family)
MKKVLVILMLIFAFGCSDDVTAPVDSELVGKWKTNFTRVDEKGESSVALLILEFKNDGTFSLSSNKSSEFMININGTFSVTDDILTVINYACGDIKGGYKFKFRDNGIKLTEIQDECGNNSLLNLFYYNFDAVLEDK